MSLEGALMYGIRIMLIVPLLVTALVDPVAAAPDFASVTRISGPSPFAPDGCGVSTGSPNAEASPAIAVNPKDARNIVVAWEQDNVPSHPLGVVVAATFDGGETWTHEVVPGLSVCSGSDMEYVFEPHLSFGPDGVVYLATFSRGGEGPLPEDPVLGAFGRVLISTSADGGLSWSGPVKVIEHDLLNDLETIAAEPDVPGAAVALWTTLEGGTAVVGEPTFMSRTTNHGATWTKSLVLIASPTTTAHNQIVALPDGTLIDVFEESKIEGFFTGEPEPAEIFAISSRDKGRSWSRRIRLGSGEAFRWPSAAIAPNGDVHVAWRELDPDGAYRIRATTSPDGGATWRPAATVESQVAGSVPWGINTLPSPGIAVAVDGTVTLLYGDLRNDEPGGVRSTDVWLSQSKDGSDTWVESQAVEPFDLHAVPENESGLGHGQAALTASGDHFLAALVLASPYVTSGPTDIYLAHIVPAGASTAVTK